MVVKLLPLQELMEKTDEKTLSHLLSSFICSRSKDSEYFLKKTSLVHEKNSISRTYLLTDADEKTIYGYFTLALKCLMVHDHNELNQDIIDLMNLSDDVAQAYLIGQLARSDYTGPGFGKAMIGIAEGILSDGNRMFGCRTVRLDCKDGLIGYYRSCGFRLLRKNTDTDLNQMVTFI